jgi:HlyD family secretion protein
MKKTNKSKRKYWVIGSILLLILILWLANKETGKSQTLVQTAKVERRDIQEIVSASGKIYPSTEVKISSDVSGEIVELNVQEGDSVIKGQLLLKINPDTYLSSVERGNAALNSAKSQKAMAEAQMQSAVAQREQIDAQLTNAKTIFNRSKALLADKVISLQEYEASEASLRGLEANVRAAQATVNSAKSNVEAAEYAIRSAQASLNELRTSLQRTAIYAPSNGIISRLNVQKGERVVGTIQMTGTELMRIANLDFMEVQVEVTESEILRIQMGQEVDIEVDAYLGQKFNGNVFQIANSATLPAGSIGQTLAVDQISNFTVKIRINPESYESLHKLKTHPFRPGMSASVNIKTSKSEQALCVPVQAVSTRDFNEKDSKYSSDSLKVTSSKADIREVVFLYDNGVSTMVEVKTGLQDDSFIEILSGLEVDNEVITGPFTVVSKKLKDKMEVKLSITDKK